MVKIGGLASGGHKGGENRLICDEMCIRDSRSFVQEQGTAFLANVDDWLESHRMATRPKNARRGGRQASGLTAGVHVFAFLGDSRRS